MVFDQDKPIIHARWVRYVPGESVVVLQEGYVGGFECGSGEGGRHGFHVAGIECTAAVVSEGGE